MKANCTYIPYEQTGYFSNIVIDYINGNEKLHPFYKHPVTVEGILSAIKERQSFGQQREILVNELNNQYKGISLSVKLARNIQSLLQSNTFTVTTAHQPNIF